MGPRAPRAPLDDTVALRAYAVSTAWLRTDYSAAPETYASLSSRQHHFDDPAPSNAATIVPVAVRGLLFAGPPALAGPGVAGPHQPRADTLLFGIFVIAIAGSVQSLLYERRA